MAQLSESPKTYGILLFPGFQALDVFGPLDILNTLSQKTALNLFIISSSMEPVSTTISSTISPFFGQSVVPTHTFANAPDLDVLIIPGGLGTRDPKIQSAVDFVKTANTKYIFTVCTGSWIAARAGILEGKRATSNKRSWAGTIELPGVNWVAHARWVVDGNIWSSSGIAAGIDAMLAFVETFYGAEIVEEITNGLEYERHRDPSWDPFADMYNL
ncbi:class I glutamine amidotransferase-like protein [Mycena floridula]|nr:class I glutamine amidotransferase-like protein [Mycena floridula]